MGAILYEMRGIIFLVFWRRKDQKENRKEDEDGKKSLILHMVDSTASIARLAPIILMRKTTIIN